MLGAPPCRWEVGCLWLRSHTIGYSSFHSLHLCLVYARLCVTAWVNLQFAVTSSKTKLLSRIPNQSDAAAARQKQRYRAIVRFFIFSLIQPMFTGWMDDYSGWLSMCVTLKLCYAAYSLQHERPSDKIHPCDLHTSARLPITEAQRFKLRQSMDPFRFCSHTSVAIATHTHLDNFRCLVKAPSDWSGVTWGSLPTEPIRKPTHTNKHSNSVLPISQLILNHRMLKRKKIGHSHCRKRSSKKRTSFCFPLLFSSSVLEFVLILHSTVRVWRWWVT